MDHHITVGLINKISRSRHLELWH